MHLRANKLVYKNALKKESQRAVETAGWTSLACQIMIAMP